MTLALARTFVTAFALFTALGLLTAGCRPAVLADSSARHRLAQERADDRCLGCLEQSCSGSFRECREDTTCRCLLACRFFPARPPFADCMAACHATASSAYEHVSSCVDANCNTTCPTQNNEV